MRTAKTTFKRLGLALAIALAGTSLLAGPAKAAFGFAGFDGEARDAAGHAYTQAGGHPFVDEVTKIAFTEGLDESGLEVPEEAAKRLEVVLPEGFVANPIATPSLCTEEELMTYHIVSTGTCPVTSQVGTTLIDLGNGGVGLEPLYNMVPAPGEPAQLGLRVGPTDVHIDTAIREVDGVYRAVAELNGISNLSEVIKADTSLWGTPADPSHDAERFCTGSSTPGCASGASEVPFVTTPRACTAPGVGLETSAEAESWQGSKASASFFSHIQGDPLTQQGPTGCGKVPFNPAASATPTSHEAETPSGLSFKLDMPTDGILSPGGIAQSDLKKAVVTLPEGVTINPSQASGLGVCAPSQLGSTELSFHATPGKGCPSDSKIGTVLVHTPLLNETVEGDVYVAAPRDNPFNSLLALYVVLENPQRGILIKLPGEVKPDPKTGQIAATFDNLPQLPFSSFEFHFREGARSPLVTPPACGPYTTQADFYPWARPAAVTHTTSSFEITSGIGGAPCPSGGLPPFHPGLVAGSINNNAGSYSPFDVRLSRNDDEQEITHFSIKLPPGITGKLAGTPFCSDAAIEASKQRTGAQELASPSCPAASQVGRSLAGAGVGSVPVYVPGKVYLAGPYKGSALSIAAITAAKVGPFDLGTVVVREALKINPETAEVFVDATGSDPIPHIIEGVTTHLRDIRAYVDKPEFVLNPTSCERTSTASTVLGSGLDFFSAADDRPFTATSPFQAANCANLGFKPALQLSLKGGTKRGANPALRATLLPRAGDANSARVSVQLPHSEFLDQSHIRTVCTRVQFKAGAGNGAECPAGAIYGHARAFSPLLAEPLEGPVFLRSSEHPLPDLVLAMHGLFDFDAVGRIDSVQGGIRNTFDFVPDAPITKVVLTMQGGKKGLLVNSTDICKGTHKAIARFTAHNGKVANFNPPLQAKCAKKAKKNKQQRHARAAG